MNNKQIGGLEHARDNEFISKINQEFIKLIQVINTKDLSNIIVFENNLLKNIIPTESIDLNENKLFQLDDVTEIFDTTLYYTKQKKQTDTRRKTSFYELITIIDEFIEKNKSDYLTNKLNSDVFYFKLSMLLKNFKCNNNTRYTNTLLSLKLHILTYLVLCILNKKYFKQKFEILKENLITKLYSCYGFIRGTKEILFVNEKDKKIKKQVSAEIVLLDKLFNNNLCSPYEVDLIKKNTNFFDTPKKAAIFQSIISGTIVTVLAAVIYSVTEVVAPVVKFPLYVTPILSVVGALTATPLNQFWKEYTERSLKFIEEKGLAKTIIKNWYNDKMRGFGVYSSIDMSIYEYKTSNISCVNSYINAKKEINDFKKDIEKYYDDYLFKKEVYIKIFYLLCDDSDNAKQIDETIKTLNTDDAAPAVKIVRNEEGNEINKEASLQSQQTQETQEKKNEGGSKTRKNKKSKQSIKYMKNTKKNKTRKSNN